MSKRKDRMYGSLSYVLQMAYDRAAKGKGKDRHANDLPFEDQPMQIINRLTDCGFSYGQIYKKVLEIPNLPEDDDKVNEMLDVIVYACGYVLVKTEKRLGREVGGDDFSGLPETTIGR